MQEMKALSPRQQLALVTLAHYKHVSSSQLMRAGVATRSTNLSRVLRPLKENRLIESFSTVFPGKGKQENVYYLLRKGALILQEIPGLDIPRIRFPKNNQPFLANDRFHRLRTNDIYFFWNQFATNYAINNRVITYYDFVRDPKTKRPVCEARFEIELGGNTKSIIPDLVVVCNHQDQYSIYLVEAAVTPNTVHIMGGINGHISLIESQSAPQMLGISREIDPRILFVFEDAKTRDIISTAFRSDHNLAGYEPYFLFATYPDLQSSFDACWATASGKRMNPFVFP